MLHFYNVDQHISVISDIKHIFNQLGHSVESDNLSGHSELLAKTRADIPMLNGDSWCGFWNRDEEYDFDHDYYDAFIVTYPPIFCRLYDKIDKPVIVQIPIRYEHGVDGDKDGWLEFNEYLRENIDRKKIYLVANSMYDKLYTEAFVNREVRYIPSLCEYTNASYNRTDNRCLFIGDLDIDGSRLIVKKQKALQYGHTWNQVAAFAGVVYFPYNISVMSFFEQYSMGMPVMVPSIDFMMELYQKGAVLSQYSWAKTYNRESGSIIPFTGEYDPNAHKDLDSVRHWLQYADFYNQEWFPYVKQFANIDELNTQINEASNDRKNNYYNMKCKQHTRRSRIINIWSELIGEVKRDWGIQ